MTGISRKLPDTERSRLKKILKRIVPDDTGVIVRTAAEGASEEQLVADISQLDNPQCINTQGVVNHGYWKDKI